MPFSLRIKSWTDRGNSKYFLSVVASNKKLLNMPSKKLKEKYNIFIPTLYKHK